MQHHPSSGFPKGGLGKFKTFGDELTLDILELQMKTKKKVLVLYISNFKTYTRYFGVSDENLKNKKSWGAIDKFYNFYI